MAIIRIPIILNKGRIGIPLYKLGAIVKETETFLRMLAEDIQLPGDKGKWLGLNFSNGSVAFNAEYVEPVEPPQVELFANSFTDIGQGNDNPLIRRNTRSQYARIARQLDEDEIVEFGIYKDPEKQPPELLSLSKRDISTILGEIQGPVESFGSIQGIIHSVFVGSSPRHFFIRELSSGDLIKCIYTSSQHPDLVRALREEGLVIHAYGLIRMDMVNRKIEQIVMQSIQATEKLSSEEFEEFFGSCPDFTGQLSTQAFIDQIRGRDDESETLH